MPSSATIGVPFEPQQPFVAIDPSRVVYRLERPDDDHAVGAICDRAFGPGRYVRAAERIRERFPVEPNLCFVGIYEGGVVGSVRVTEIATKPGTLMLGPLAVRPALKGVGIGRALLRRVEGEARAMGYRSIFLVGDGAYYAANGYRPAAPGRIALPRPADPARVLVLDL